MASHARPGSAGTIGDPARLQALHQVLLLDTPAEDVFDRFTRMAARASDAPMAAIHLIDEHRVFWKSEFGVPSTISVRRSRPIGEMLSPEVVETAAPLVVADVRSFPRYAHKAIVAELRLAGYAAIPLQWGDGHVIGALEVMDTRPRDWSPETVELMGDLARAVTAEIDSRVEAREIRRSETQFRQLAENIREVFWLTDADKTEMVYVSPQYEVTWGRSRASLYQEPVSWLDAVLPEDRGRVVDALRHIKERGISEEYRIRRPDGTVRWIWTHGFPIRDPAGVVFRLAGLAEDITDRKAAEEIQLHLAEARAAQAMKEREAYRFRLLSDASRLLAASLDYHGTADELARMVVERIADVCVVDVLDGDELRHAGMAVGDTEAVPLLQNVIDGYPERLAAGKHPVTEVLRTGKPVTRSTGSGEGAREEEPDPGEVDALRRRGLAAVHIEPLTVRGQTLGAVTFATAGPQPRQYDEDDVALLAELARRTAMAVDNCMLFEKAVAGSTAKSDFLAVISHELRTPLTAVTGYASLLQSEIAGPVTDKQRAYLERIDVSATHLLDLIGEILDFAQTESADVQLDIGTIDLNSVVRDAVSIVELSAKEKGLELDLEEAPEATVQSDGPKIRRILVNLLRNATKYTQRGGVTVSLEREGEGFSIHVADTGIGIPADQTERVFEPFVQLEAAATRSQPGTGLGLTIARRVTEALGGRITLESEVGKGSTFTLWVPERIGPRRVRSGRRGGRGEPGARGEPGGRGGRGEPGARGGES